MDNKEIIQILKLTASLLKLYGENQFKVRSYQTAVYNLERNAQKLIELGEKQLAELPGVGKSIAATIREISQTGVSSTLDNLLKQTPKGILELLKVKGVGARKIKTVWDQLGVETAEELLSAATRGELAELSGFGKKTQDKIQQIISFYLSNKHLIHYKDADLLGLNLEQQIKLQFPDARWSRAGSFRRKVEVVGSLDYVWASDSVGEAEDFLDSMQGLDKNLQLSGPLRWRGEFRDNSELLDVRFCNLLEFGTKLLYYTGNMEHLSLTNEQGKSLREVLEQSHSDESTIYSEMGWPVIIPELREGLYENEFLRGQKMENILVTEDLKGILHNHSTYSDGKHSLEEMARACNDLGYEYLGISDHSQTAVYANGLNEEKVLEQHREIDRLNQELTPFKIFKGIESDILSDGSLDYPEPILHTFDFVVASVHSNLNMDIDKATERLLRAVKNPNTTVLGHPTGRLLLKREGYPIDHQKVIDACAVHGVVIELNANPWRLDLDWRWVHYAVEKGVKISINPDAHEKVTLKDVYYGVCVARKTGLTKVMTFNAMNLEEMNHYLSTRKSKSSLHSNV
ncbi:MAG: DNA polymerase/3'-5' exonuclease PolX [Bacteroidetes bacterium]|nr:MAG: DNA polymerase/3'-5' exonuclease PolX [Bacteroidota bacterium]